MKAVLEFDLPEDNSEHIMCVNASKYYCCLWDIDQELRSLLKHGHQHKSVEELAESLREKIREKVDLYEVE